MKIRSRLLRLLGADDYVPMRREEIANVLKLDKTARREFWPLLDQMLESGEIARLKKDKLCIPADADLISGTIRFRQSGSATIYPDKKTEDSPIDGYPVRAEDTATAFNGDTVLARIVDSPPEDFRRGRASRKDDDRQHLRVIRILKRAREIFVGTLEQGRHYAYVIPDDPRIIQDFLVPDPKNCGLKPPPEVGDKVVIQLQEWKQRHLNPAAEIIEVLGKTNEPDAEFKGILRKYGLEPDFAPEVMEAVREYSETVDERDKAGRLDCRDWFTFTIDPDDAKDFDDALSINELDNGGLRIGVHIADVASYVRKGSILDTEAKKRGNSTYLVGTVIPMLPHILSNGLCSLVEGQDRLTKCVLLTYDKDATLTGVEFANTIICSNKRLTYNQASAFLKNDNLDEVRQTPLPAKHQTGSTGRALTELSKGEMAKLQKSIRQLWSVAGKLRKARFSKGSLDLDMPEVKIYVDEQGYADRVIQPVHDESHQLIEEFMLAANEQVARLTKRNNLPCVYRVHEEPEEEKLNELRETMKAFGVQCGNLTRPREMNNLLGRLKDHPQGYTLKINVLRSLKQANYGAEALGHFGLAKKDYTHFTSPIRRYADLVVHRVFDHHLMRSGSPYAQKESGSTYSKEQIASIAEHISITERNSTDAERESVKTKLLEYFERELEKPERSRYPAAICDIKNHGMFVELTDTLTYGLIHISTLDDDFYMVSGDGTALIGRKNRRRYLLGQRIMVEVSRVDRHKQQIDFRVAERSSGAKGQKISRIPRKRAGKRGAKSADPSKAGGQSPREGKVESGPPPRKRRRPKANKHPARSGAAEKPAARTANPDKAADATSAPAPRKRATARKRRRNR